MGDAPQALDLMGRISGLLLSVYVLAKTLDTLLWINRTSPDRGFPAAQFYSWRPFGTWILLAEILGFGLIPALILLTPPGVRQRSPGSTIFRRCNPQRRGRRSKPTRVAR